MAMLVGLVACQKAEVHQAEFYVFGTLVDVKVRGVQSETAVAAFNELQARFQAMHRDWHAWEPGMLHDINVAFGEGHPAVATPELIELLRRSQQLEAESNGHFNAAMGGLVGLWGFHTSHFPVLGPPPDDSLIQGWLGSHPSAREIVIEGDTLRTANPAVQLDFGGIAKGYAVDAAMRDLARHGIEAAIVNAGGDLRARGWDGDPWIIGIQHPAGGVLGVIEVREDESVFTSGVNQRYRQDGSVRYPHVLNPHTGYPVQGLQSATVIAVEGMTADAAATALLVAGPEEWPDTARRLGIGEVLVVDDSGAVFMTPSMNRRVRLFEEYENSAGIVDTSAVAIN
jgi:thiamine biosynthesis lipoprotein